MARMRAISNNATPVLGTVGRLGTILVLVKHRAVRRRAVVSKGQGAESPTMGGENV